MPFYFRSAGFCASIVCLVSSLPAQVPQSEHVMIVVEENRSYEQVIGNTAMPYLNRLAKSNALAGSFFANSHYSLPNYFWLTAGNFVTLNEGTTAVFDVDNVVRYLLTAGKTWKIYAEGLPSVGYTGASQGSYLKDHNPFAYYSDVINSSQKLNIVPFPQLAVDSANSTLPNYSFIVPNKNDDGHNSSSWSVDQWLKSKIAPLLASPLFQPGGDGILFITFDESVDSDCRPLASCPHLPENGGGGKVATVVVGPMVKKGYRSTIKYQHPSILRTMLAALGITQAPGSAQTAPLMSDFFVQ